MLDVCVYVWVWIASSVESWSCLSLSDRCPLSHTERSVLERTRVALDKWNGSRRVRFRNLSIVVELNDVDRRQPVLLVEYQT